MANSYTITLQAVRTYTIQVTATDEDEDEAHDMALDLWCGSEDPDFDFDGRGDGIEVIRVEEDDRMFAQMEYDEDYYRASAQ